MSAADIIAQIKQLPPDEKRTVTEYVISQPPSEAQDDGEEPSFQAAADEVFTKYDNLLRKLAQ